MLIKNPTGAEWGDLDPGDIMREALAPKPPPRACTSCGRELCRELDAYHGRDSEQAKRCDRCRRGR